VQAAIRAVRFVSIYFPSQLTSPLYLKTPSRQPQATKATTLIAKRTKHLKTKKYIFIGAPGLHE